MKRLRVFLFLLIIVAAAGCDLLPHSGSDAGAEEAIMIESTSEIDTSGVQIADFRIEGKEIQGDILKMEVSYSGGCKEHSFSLYSTPPIVETNPPGTETFLIHDGNGDTCEALGHKEIEFDISPMQTQREDVIFVFLHKNLESDWTRLRYDY